MRATTTLQTSAVVLALLSTTPAFANVQFRIGYEASSNEYVVYMTPDSTPAPDMVLSSQVTIAVPHGTGTSRFEVDNIRTSVPGVSWANNSRVDAPKENGAADYLSFSLFYTGSRPPTFGWVAGTEKRIFAFKSPSGCVSGISLLNNSDPFNQLPNSTSTNPGNDFSNIGWLSSNAYTGNYGGNVSCNGTTVPVVPVTSTCEKNTAKVGAIVQETWVLNNLINQIQPATQRANMQKKLLELRGLLLCR
ncbi:MAG: hypothetical protein PHE17_17440 [Thiothrix sp.]|uniref:hypothetical protein n=1 Tax=Thiothrix sp. TaxID=1032 RepID=UPI00262E0958|nr:hypothetical protein [Thiothrix sp.]MDD5394804.1 hypothetical protein [Thiothrix sp.]